MPPGTARYWSWLFAAADSRNALLGIYALGAEWQALMDPATETSVAQLKLAWWQDEMQRLATGAPTHPISGYLAALPRARAVDFTPLLDAVDAAGAWVSGVPLERDADLEAHADALWGAPLALASRLAAAAPQESSVRNCTRALAAAAYLSKALHDYRRDARAGRVPFGIDELLKAGVDNDDLAAGVPPPHLQAYLGRLRERAFGYFEIALRALPCAERSRHRHLLVLAALGSSHLHDRLPPRSPLRWRDMLLAWRTARGAFDRTRSLT